MRFILFLLSIININAMESRAELYAEIANTNNIEKLCWYLNGLKMSGTLNKNCFDSKIILPAFTNHRIAALKLLQTFGWDIDKKEDHYCFDTCLDESCWFTEFERVVFLAYLGANLNKKNSEGNNSALIAASFGLGWGVHSRDRKEKILQFLLSQNAQKFNNEHLTAPEYKSLLQSKTRPPIPEEARTIMLDLARDKKNIACTLRKQELGIK